MTIMSDNWITKMAREENMIAPFVDGQKKDGTISYGVSSYGYDARVSSEFKVFTNLDSVIVDPKNFNEKSFVDRSGVIQNLIIHLNIKKTLIETLEAFLL